MQTFTLDQLNRLCQQSAVSHLGIEFCAISEQSLSAFLTVDQRTIQPFGVLHGGVSALLAETVASAAAMRFCNENQTAVGTELNISHLKAVRSGKVTATASPLHLGKQSHVWQVELQDEQGNLCAVARLNLRLVTRTPSASSLP